MSLFRIISQGTKRLVRFIEIFESSIELSTVYTVLYEVS